MTMTTDRFTFLRKVPLFRDLPDPDLEKICQRAEEVNLPAGETLFTEGSVGHDAYVIEEGQIEIYKTASGKEVQLAIRKEGEVIGEIALLEDTTRNASGRALVDSHLLVISRDQFEFMVGNSPSAARVMLHTVIRRLQDTENLLRQSEKMAQLGTFTAGIAHELNNPAAAVQRGTDQLQDCLEKFNGLILSLSASGIPANVLETVLRSERPAADQAYPELGALERSDRETEIEDWISDRGIAEAWEYAPTLVDLGYQCETLEQLAGKVPASGLPLVIEWITIESTARFLLDEINQGAGRISEIVKALKSYIYLDQAPAQTVDVHDGIENTLVILRYKLKKGVEVHRDFAQDLPRIDAYGSELNQVWTNLIDNAIDAMDGRGNITIRTRYQQPWVIVEVEDDGPGIPTEIQPRIFNPFFTTKPVGQGTGLGLNISYNIIQKHQGEIKVYSRPGQTRFEVWLPVSQNAAS